MFSFFPQYNFTVHSCKTNLTLSVHWQEKNTEMYRPALEELRRQIRSSTTSMTSVPKPLKFLRPHYGKLKEIYDGMAPGENKVGFDAAKPSKDFFFAYFSPWKWC